MLKVRPGGGLSCYKTLKYHPFKSYFELCFTLIMFDLKVIHSVLGQLEEERGIPREKIIEAIEIALATAYKKEYGKRGQIVRAKFDINTGATEFYQVKIVADESRVIVLSEGEEMPEL